MSQGRLHEVLSIGWRARQSESIDALSDGEKQLLGAMVPAQKALILRLLSDATDLVPTQRALVLRLLSDATDAEEARRLLASRPASQVPSPVPQPSGTQGMQMEDRRLELADHADAKKPRVDDPVYDATYFKGADPKTVKAFLRFVSDAAGQEHSHTREQFGIWTDEEFATITTITNVKRWALRGVSPKARRALRETGTFDEWFEPLYGLWIQYKDGMAAANDGGSFRRSEAEGASAVQLGGPSGPR